MPATTTTLKTLSGNGALYDAFFEHVHAAWAEPSEHPAGIMLPGGNTPKPIYKRLSEEPFKAAESAWAILSDERHVLPGDPDGNIEYIRPMTEALGVNDEHLLRVPYSVPLDDAAEAYATSLQRFFDSDGVLHTAFIGLGADGHTCSLFTPENLEAAQGKLAIPVTRPEPPHRVSVTPSVLSRARQVVILVSGEEKRDVAQQLIDDPESMVAGRAIANCENVEVWFRE